MHENLALMIWAVVWGSAGAVAGLVFASLCFAARKADDDTIEMASYDRGFRAGYEQASFDAMIAQAGIEHVGR